MSKNTAYHDIKDQQNIEKIRELERMLPDYVKGYIRSIAPSTTSRTRLCYAYELRIFFQFLKDQNPELAHSPLHAITLEQISMLTPADLDEYMEYLRLYRNEENKVITNKDTAIKQKMSAVRGLFRYLYKRGHIPGNPTELIRMPKVRDKAIIKLDPNESAMLLDYIEKKGEKLSGRQLTKYNNEKARDYAIITTLLGTGIRVSECVGLDVTDIDFNNNSLKVFRKGGKEAFVFFGDEVAEALEDYLVEREGIHPLPGHENALFYSDRNTRITERTVERLVKSYGSAIAPNKKVSPHTLRRTFGTNLYEDSSDIYLVADALGHNDINTTKKHYAALDTTRKKLTIRKLRIRQE